MNFTGLFIRRPVMTTLVMAGILIFGLVAYRQLPVSDLPAVDYPTITVSAGLFAGLDRPTAARFAFLLGLPLTAGAGLLKTASLLRHGLAGGEATALGIGLLASFVAGLLAVWLLIRYLQRRTLAVFVVYRIALGLLILALIGAGALR